VVAALTGASSNVKLTMGPGLRSLKGAARKCRTSVLLTLAFSEDNAEGTVSRDFVKSAQARVDSAMPDFMSYQPSV
jgi:hypothetical protein